MTAPAAMNKLTEGVIVMVPPDGRRVFNLILTFSRAGLPVEASVPLRDADIHVIDLLATVVYPICPVRGVMSFEVSIVKVMATGEGLTFKLFEQVITAMLPA